MARSRNHFGRFIFGPVLVVGACLILWKNEGRFDYYRAAAGTETIVTPQGSSPDQLISYTAKMNRQLVIPGQYVEAFTGYLVVVQDDEKRYNSRRISL